MLCEVPEPIKAFIAPYQPNLECWNLSSPLKHCQFAQLEPLILFLPVIFFVPQNKIIYIGCLLALWEG